MIKLGTSKVKFYLGSNKVKAIYKGSTKVWSGASIVSYYDGTTLLGTEEVEEGEDVLHPDIDTTKANYTLYGWSTSPNGQRTAQMVANGEPMTLYAIYLPDTITVCVSSRSGSSATVSVWNSKYMGGSAYVIQESPGPSLTASANFSITLNEYQNSEVTVWTHDYTIDDQGYGHDYTGSMNVDGVSKVNGNVLNDLSGVHSMSVHAFPDWGIGERFERASGGLAKVELTNPIAWV